MAGYTTYYVESDQPAYQYSDGYGSSGSTMGYSSGYGSSGSAVTTTYAPYAGQPYYIEQPVETVVEQPAATAPAAEIDSEDDSNDVSTGSNADAKPPATAAPAQPAAPAPTRTVVQRVYVQPARPQVMVYPQMQSSYYAPRWRIGNRVCIGNNCP